MTKVKGAPQILYQPKSPIDQTILSLLNILCGSITNIIQGFNNVLICVEHLANWPLARAIKNETAEIVIKFVEEELVPYFGRQKL